MTDDHSAARDLRVVEFLDQVLGLLTAEKLWQAMEEAGWQITRRDPAAGRVCISVETARFIKRELNRLSDHEQFEDADVAERHRRELEDAITEATTG